MCFSFALHLFHSMRCMFYAVKCTLFPFSMTQLKHIYTATPIELNKHNKFSSFFFLEFFLVLFLLKKKKQTNPMELQGDSNEVMMYNVILFGSLVVCEYYSWFQHQQFDVVSKCTFCFYNKWVDSFAKTRELPVCAQSISWLRLNSYFQMRKNKKINIHMVAIDRKYQNLSISQNVFHHT